MKFDSFILAYFAKVIIILYINSFIGCCLIFSHDTWIKLALSLPCNMQLYWHL